MAGCLAFLEPGDPRKKAGCTAMLLRFMKCSHILGVLQARESLETTEAKTCQLLHPGASLAMSVTRSTAFGGEFRRTSEPWSILNWKGPTGINKSDSWLYTGPPKNQTMCLRVLSDSFFTSSRVGAFRQCRE